MYTHLTERVHRSATQPPAMVNFHENEQETNSIMHGPSNVLGGRAQTISSPIHRGPRASSTEVPIAPAPEVFIPPPSPPPPPPVAAEAAAVAKGGASSPLSPRPEIRPGPLNCDDIADLDLWFECENNKRLAVGQDVATAPPPPPPPPSPPPQVPQAPEEDCDAILDIESWFDSYPLCLSLYLSAPNSLSLALSLFRAQHLLHFDRSLVVYGGQTRALSPLLFFCHPHSPPPPTSRPHSRGP